jgi:DNA replication protein DnaC
MTTPKDSNAPLCRNFNCNNTCHVREFGEDGIAIYETLCTPCMVHWNKMVLSVGKPKEPKPETPMPALFEDTEPERIGEPLGQFAVAWQPSGKGLLIHGSTRKGKTRTAWYIANRLWKTDRYKNKYLFLTMFELEARIASSWGNSTWDKTMLHMTNVPLLFLDDLGKEKMTDRMASCLFALVDQRTMHQRPTIITTNLTGETLLERFHDKETGAAFVARLKDPDLFQRVAAK